MAASLAKTDAETAKMLAVAEAVTRARAALVFLTRVVAGTQTVLVKVLEPTMVTRVKAAMRPWRTESGLSSARLNLFAESKVAAWSDP